MASEDGGPLFVRDGEKEICRLSVRDWFAGMAFGQIRISDDEPIKFAAHLSYALADAMLAERAKGKEQT